MSAETMAFRAASRGGVLDELARLQPPARARILLEGEAAVLASEVVLRLAGGSVVAVEAGAVSGARALMRVFLADLARLEVRADELGPSDVPGPRLQALAAEAEASALALLATVAPLGGLGGCSSPIWTRSSSSSPRSPTP